MSKLEEWRQRELLLKCKSFLFMMKMIEIQKCAITLIPRIPVMNILTYMCVHVLGLPQHIVLSTFNKFSLCLEYSLFQRTSVIVLTILKL